jgi:hypothetical protein
LSGGGCRPVEEPSPLSPRLIAGLSSSASAGPIGCTSGLDAFELGALDLGVLVGFLGASGFFAMAGNIGTNPPLGSDLIRFLIALLTGSGQSHGWLRNRRPDRSSTTCHGRRRKPQPAATGAPLTISRWMLWQRLHCSVQYSDAFRLPKTRSTDRRPRHSGQCERTVDSGGG